MYAINNTIRNNVGKGGSFVRRKVVQILNKVYIHDATCIIIFICTVSPLAKKWMCMCMQGKAGIWTFLVSFCPKAGKFVPTGNGVGKYREGSNLLSSDYLNLSSLITKKKIQNWAVDAYRWKGEKISHEK